MQPGELLNTIEQPLTNPSSQVGLPSSNFLLEKTVGNVVVSFIKTLSGEIRGLIPQTDNTPPRAVPVIGISSQSLENLEAVKELVQKSRFITYPDRLEMQVALKEGILTAAPQTALQTSPLGRKSEQGFNTTLESSHPYRQKHPQWCKKVENEFSWDREEEEFSKQCKIKMGILADEGGMGTQQRHFVKQINRAIQSILDRLDHSSCSSFPDIQRFIYTVCENTYKFIFFPVWEIMSYSQQPFQIFIFNQNAFKEELKREFTLFNEESDKVLNQILKAIQANKIDTVCRQLEGDYPSQKATIQRLKAKSKFLIQVEQQKIQKEIDTYLNQPQIQACLENIIYKECPQMRNYRYSLAEMPSRDFARPSLPYHVYTDNLIAYLKAWQELQVSSKNLTDWLQFKTTLERTFNDKKSEHFQNKIKPLIQFRQSIENILLWPQEYLLSEKEEDYLMRNLHRFMEISNSALADKILISYDYQHIPEQKLKQAETTLKSPKSSSEQKREACRLLLHAQIPWRDLYTVGCMLHRAGSVSEETARHNRRLVSQALPDLVTQLPLVKRAIENLIEFELKECSDPTFYDTPKKIPENSYCFIHLLGSFSVLQSNFEKLQQTLGFWTNQRLLGNDYAQPKIRYAMLRTIQILGELFKNLRSARALSEDEIWECIEDLRDLLAHLERERVQKRLTAVIQNPHQPASHMFASLLDNFRSLGEHFQSHFSISNNLQTWVGIKQRHTTPIQHRTCLALEGLQNLYLYLAEKIPETKQEELKKTVKNAKVQQTRKEIGDAQQALLNGNYQSVELTKLPLTQNQQTKIKECIKVLQSPKAAENNAKHTKPANLNKLTSIFNHLSTNKFSEENKAHVEKIKETLALKEDEKGDAEVISNLDLLKDATFKTRIRHVQGLFQALKKEWPNQSQIEIIEDLLLSLTESSEDFVARKKKEFFSILERMEIIQEDQQVDVKVEDLIRSLQLYPSSSQTLKLKLKALGITDKSDEALWESVSKSCLKEKISPSKLTTKDENQTAKKKALKAIEAITDKIQTLKYLLPFNLQSEKAFYTYINDPILQLATQYLVSAFRSSASSLELAIEAFRHNYPDKQSFFQDIQHDLTLAIRYGNNILHVHDVSEPDTRTSNGHIFNNYRYLQSLLQNLSLQSNSHLQLPSFIQKLEFLKNLLT